MTTTTMRRSPEELTWTCPTCGLIEPTKIGNGILARYYRRMCDCEIQEGERRRKEHEKQQAEEDKRREREYNWKRTYSWLGDRWSDLSLQAKTFDNFDASKQQEAFDTTKLFMQIMKGSLVLHGTYGTGKTHLLAALCNQFLQEKGKPSLFVTAPKLFAAIQSCIQREEDYSRFIGYAVSTSLLIIDDIDKAKRTDFREEIYFDIIDERVKRGNPIAISTNRLDDLANFVGGAVCSRLKVGQIAVEMIGVDYREGLEA